LQRARYADCWGEERAILEEFLEFLDRHHGYTLVSYSGTGFDYRVTQNAARRHGLDTQVMERFPHIDLCTLLRRCFVFPHQGYALKGLGGYLHYGFRQTDLDGLAVALGYKRYIEFGAALDVRVLEYNEDNVLVLWHLVDRCLSIRRFSHTFGTHVIRVDGSWAYIEAQLITG